jgi:hypothetical protein
VSHLYIIREDTSYPIFQRSIGSQLLERWAIKCTLVIIYYTLFQITYHACFYSELPVEWSRWSVNTSVILRSWIKNNSSHRSSPASAIDINIYLSISIWEHSPSVAYQSCFDFSSTTSRWREWLLNHNSVQYVVLLTGAFVFRRIIFLYMVRGSFVPRGNRCRLRMTVGQ